MAMRRLIQAINDALIEEMERDPRIVLFGEDVKISMFGDTKGLAARFGASRVRNTPIAEETLSGMAVGVAATGRPVILHMMFSNFLYPGFDGIANQMTKLPFMTGGQIKLPITMLCAYGGGTSTAAQHSDTPYAMLMNLGGINIAVPATPADAKGLLKAAIRSNYPTAFFEARTRGGEQGEVPDGDYVDPVWRGADWASWPRRNDRRHRRHGQTGAASGRNLGKGQQHRRRGAGPKDAGTFRYACITGFNREDRPPRYRR